MSNWTSSTAVTFKVLKYEGNNTPTEVTTGYEIKYNSNKTVSNKKYTVPQDFTGQTFSLYINSVLVDSETITAVKNGADGRGINSTTVTHAKTSTLVDDPSKIPEYSQSSPDGWASRLPTVGENEYLWTRTIIDYSDDTDTVTYSYMYQGKTVKGDPITVKSILYQIGDTSTTPPTGTWKALSEVGTVPT
jgi:hypothetical protein